MKFSITFKKKAGDFMKISALVAEFNPFHGGHKLIIDKMKEESDAVIVIMSGNFVQRGECALFEKSERALSAIKNGADLVLELPAVYSLSSAEGFAKGAIKILGSTGCIDSLFFGSECGDISSLSSIADILNCESTHFTSLLNEKLKEGASFPASRSYALSKLTDKSYLLDMPNNILGTEYIRAIKKENLKIEPFTVARMGSGYNDTQIKENLPSASLIRAMLQKGENADKYMLYPYKSKPVFMKDFDSFFALRLKTVQKEELCAIPDCNEELAVRLKEASLYNSFYEILSSAACKSYTQSRIRRILCNLIINNKFKELPTPTYIRPLAFNKTGSDILHKMKSTASLSVASRGALLKDDKIFSLECRATDVYNLARGLKGGSEFSLSPIIV